MRDLDNPERHLIISREDGGGTAIARKKLTRRFEPGVKGVLTFDDHVRGQPYTVTGECSFEGFPALAR